MTNPKSQAEPNASPEAAKTAATGKPARKAPRRATAAAGSPTTQATATPAVLVIDANGMVVPPSAAGPQDPAAKPDAGHSPEPVTAPAAAGPDSADLAEKADKAEAPASDSLRPAREAGEPAEAFHPAAIEPDATATDNTAAESAQTPAPDKGTPDEADPTDEAAAAVADSAPGRPTAPDSGTAAESGPAGEPGTDDDVQAAGAADTASTPDSLSRPSATPTNDVPADNSGADGTAGTGLVHGTVSETGVEANAESADVPEPEEETATEAEPVPAASEAAPQSRRERRLAEQKAASGEGGAAGAGAAAAAGTEAGATTSAAPSPLLTKLPEPQAQSSVPAPRRRRSRFAAFVRGLLVLLAISAVVVAMGTVLSNPELAAEGPSPTQLQRQAAWAETTAMHAGALTLSAAAGSAELRKALEETAGQLGGQAAALDDGLPASTPSAAASPSAPVAPVTVAALLQALHDNAESLLENAMTAEHAMGRVFASVGSSQLLQAAQLGAVVGAPAKSSEFLPAKVDFPAPSGPQCSSTLAPRPGATVDTALAAAALAEQKAVYAYQVATTRFSEPRSSTASGKLARHEQKLAVLNDELQLRCLAPVSPVAGYSLDAAFTSMPAQALQMLESELSAIYADLAALSPAQGNSPDGSSVHIGTGDPAAASPATATPEPTMGSHLRELSVLWLLDSAQTSASWGGPVAALPGMAAGNDAATTQTRVAAPAS